MLFGGSQLPKLAKNLGKAQQEFKKGLSEFHSQDEDAAPVVEPPVESTQQDSTSDQ